MNLDRSTLMKDICYLALDSDSKNKECKSKALALLEDFTAHRIDESTAYDRYKSILNSNSGYWSDKYKSKVVYESLQKYQAGKLDNLATAKMVSSIITHSLIEMEQNDSVTLDDMGVQELSNILQEMINSDLNESCSNALNAILYKYGYLENKKEGD